MVDESKSVEEATALALAEFYNEAPAPYKVREYHKIQGPFKRNTEGPQRNKLIPWEWTREEFGFLQHVPWRFTEKVDGTNVRVVWDGHSPTFLGRTDRAQMPTRLLKALQETFTEELLEQVFGETPAILFGEGYGAGIQKGGIYRPDVAFILFDVWINDFWLEYVNVHGIGDQLGIETVPVVSTSNTLNQMIQYMAETELHSLIADTKTTMEGVVGTPLVPLLSRRGGRIVIKLKTEDLYQLALAQDLKSVPVSLPLAA